MTNDEIYFYETVELPGIWRKLGFKSAIREGETEDQAFNRVFEKVQQWQKQSASPSFERVANEPLIPVVSINDSMEVEVNMVDQINSCSDLKILDTYKLIVRSNPEWNEVYRKKLIELKNKSKK